MEELARIFLALIFLALIINLIAGGRAGVVDWLRAKFLGKGSGGQAPPHPAAGLRAEAPDPAGG